MYTVRLEPNNGTFNWAIIWYQDGIKRPIRYDFASTWLGAKWSFRRAKRRAERLNKMVGE